MKASELRHLQPDILTALCTLAVYFLHGYRKPKLHHSESHHWLHICNIYRKWTRWVDNRSQKVHDASKPSCEEISLCWMISANFCHHPVCQSHQRWKVPYNSQSTALGLFASQESVNQESNTCTNIVKWNLLFVQWNAWSTPRCKSYQHPQRIEKGPYKIYLFMAPMTLYWYTLNF